MPKSQISFFNVILLCKSLDDEHSSAFAKRRTKIIVCDHHACFKIIHMESGNVWGVVAEVYEGYDIYRAITELHTVLDDKIRKDKVVGDNNWTAVTGI